MEQIKDFFKYSIPNFFESIWNFFRYDIPIGIKNIFFFWRVIWRFRSWDYTFQLRLLSRSLEPLAHTLEYYGNEVEVPRMKKVKMIQRAIEILNRQANDNYIELAEEKLGLNVILEYKIGEEPEEVNQHNSKIFELARELEVKEWDELFLILKGQHHSQFTMLVDKAKAENVDLKSEKLWENWFNGTSMKGWWD